MEPFFRLRDMTQQRAYSCSTLFVVDVFVLAFTVTVRSNETDPPFTRPLFFLACSLTHLHTLTFQQSDIVRRHSHLNQPKSISQNSNLIPKH